MLFAWFSTRCPLMSSSECMLCLGRGLHDSSFFFSLWITLWVVSIFILYVDSKFPSRHVRGSFLSVSSVWDLNAVFTRKKLSGLELLVAKKLNDLKVIMLSQKVHFILNKNNVIIKLEFAGTHDLRNNYRDYSQGNNFLYCSRRVLVFIEYDPYNSSPGHILSTYRLYLFFLAECICI